MTVSAPHYLLFSESNPVRPGRFVASDDAQLSEAAGCWRFVLEAVDGSSKLEATDFEPQISGERLELLAVVRGLEALDQPSRVTLLTPSKYVNRGIRFGLEAWREHAWQWECFGKMMPVKNSDLWQRVDQALKIHHVTCRAWTVDTSDSAESIPVRNGGTKALSGVPSARTDETNHAGDIGETLVAATGMLDDECETTLTKQESGEPETLSMDGNSATNRRRPILRALQQTWNKCRAGIALPGMFRLGGARLSG